MSMQLTTIKMRRTLAPLTAVLIGLTSVVAAPAIADVEIVFSDYLESKIAKISFLDKKREKVFRQFRTEGTRTSISPRAALNRSRFSGTEWANERLIPDLNDYSAPSLIQAMMERGVKEANPEFDGKIVVKVETLKIRNFSLSAITSFNTRMIGDIQLMDADGNIVAEHHISAYLVPEYTATSHYDGPDYAYRQAALDTRIGPIAAEFTEKALKKMFPGYDAPGLVVVTY